ncbi:MAG: ABC transporter permease [Ignavibacteriae bacterium]|nr:ABC transporter permease [Ignavibacteriota bacterium]
MRTVLKLFIKDYTLFFRDKVALSLTFLIPVVLIFIFGKVFGGLESGIEHLQVGFINNSTAPVAQKLEKVLDSTKNFLLVKKYKDDKGNVIQYDTNVMKNHIRAGKFSSALIIPEDAFTDTSKSLKLKFFYDPKNEFEMQLVDGMLQKIIMQQIPELFQKSMMRQAETDLGKEKGSSFNSEIARTVNKYYKVDTSFILNNNPDTQNDTGRAGNIFGNIVDIEKQQLVGKEVANPMATRSVGGWAMMFLLFTITGSATSLLDEKKSGVMIRILSAPVTRSHILWSKYLFNMSLGIIQLSVMFLFGFILFKIDIFSNIFNLILIVLAASSACTAFGMLLASLVKTTKQADGWGTLLILMMSAVGGAWFPVSFMPQTIQFFSKLTIVYWSVEGFLAVLWRGAGFTDIWQYLVILVGISVAINIWSVYNFKRGNVF